MDPNGSARSGPPTKGVWAPLGSAPVPSDQDDGERGSTVVTMTVPGTRPDGADSDMVSLQHIVEDGAEEVYVAKLQNEDETSGRVELVRSLEALPAMRQSSGPLSIPASRRQRKRSLNGTAPCMVAATRSR